MRCDKFTHIPIVRLVPQGCLIIRSIWKNNQMEEKQ
nr:MAG TPA: hypothetical protein [Caudoviricetes sp.]